MEAFPRRILSRIRTCKREDNVVADALLQMDTENDALASGPELAMCMSQLY